ncbi:hypothetical protein RRG08_010411 [Elysia crispata]|uniref:Uncharacterized protein n=1 Tax=Elysia crispata TaxID=231223 RepID=A0AAE1BAP3_9GAST|nr:hypothetical protein RRG08_010411 [Elysia crispata]
MRATLTTAAIIIIIIIYRDNLRSQSSMPQHPQSAPLASLSLSLSIPHDAPPPGAYNVVQSFEQSSKPNMAKPRTEAARRKHNSFMSAASRFAQPADLVSKKPENENPVSPWQASTEETRERKPRSVSLSLMLPRVGSGRWHFTSSVNASL